MADYAEEAKRYEEALDAALLNLRGFLAQHGASHWKPVPSTAAATQETKSADGQVNGIGLPGSVAVHRRATKRGDVARATADVPVSEKVDLDAFRAVLLTPEVRTQWDSLVDKASVLETLDAQTQLVKTDFRLGWPVNPRDAVTISRTLSDETTVLHVATSLPRSPNDPLFLRPSPPYVRADIGLFAWRLQLRGSGPQRTLRLHLFWQWSLKGATVSSQYSQIEGIVRSFVDYVRRKGVLLPLITGFGRECDMVGSTYHVDRDALSLDYRVLLDSSGPLHPRKRQEGAEELAAIKEARRLERAVEVRLPADEGWDVQVSCKGQGASVDATYKVALEKDATAGSAYVLLRVTHAPLTSADQIVKVSLSISHLVGGSTFRINGETTSVAAVEPRDPSSAYQQMLQDAATAANVSLSSQDTLASADSGDATERLPPPAAAKTKAIASLIRRCYNYFTSLLQEPEQKWRPLFESKGVAVSQLSSLDPTLAIFRAEATFVGISIWDLYSALTTPGVRQLWDTTNEGVTLLDDLGESSSLWHVCTKAVWPSWARDAVLVRTSYRSQNTIHVFSFSTDDDDLFSNLPRPGGQVIRSHVDVQGWCIEALSPTTVRISLIEQSDAKGWSVRSWTPQHMATIIAGLGEYTIRNGGPPMITRQLESKLVVLRYEQDKGALKAEYLPRRGKGREAAISPAILAVEGDAAIPVEPPSETDSIECEIRCNVDVWAADIDLVVDPPPLKTSCLNRHRLSMEGGGLWITIEHDGALMTDNERVTVLVRKGTAGREKGGVSVNGKRQKIEVERLAEDAVKVLHAKKRIRAIPMPLDKAYKPSESGSSPPTPTLEKMPVTTASATIAVLPSESSPSTENLPPISPALEALAALQAFHAEEAHAPGVISANWQNTATPLNYRRIYSTLNPIHTIYRADKVIQKVSAEHLVSIITNASSRASWDERVSSMNMLESFGHGFSLSCMTTKAAFLAFRPRIFFVGTAVAYVQLPSTSSNSSTTNVYFVATASFSPNDSFPLKDLNKQSMPMGNVVIDGWILESLDPYASDQYAIPSTRCSYFTSIDYAGAMPTSFSSMLNVNPLKVMESLEKFSQTHLPPRWISPGIEVEAVGSLSRDVRGLPADGKPKVFVWQLGGAERQIVQLAHDYSPATKTFSAVVSATLRGRRPKHNARMSSAVPSTPLLNGRSSTPELRKQSSISALRSAASKHKSSASLGGADDVLGRPDEHDLVLAELLVYPSKEASSFAAETASAFVASDAAPHSLDFATAAKKEELPIKAKLWPLPVDAVNASALSPTGSGPSGRRAHLLQLYLPITESVRTLQDPLQEGASEAPTWLKRLKEGLLLVQLQIVGTAGSESDAGLSLSLNGTEIAPTLNDDASARLIVNGASEDDGPRRTGPQLSRVTAKSTEASEDLLVVPKSLINARATSSLRQGRPAQPVVTINSAVQPEKGSVVSPARSPTPDGRTASLVAKAVGPAGTSSTTASPAKAGEAPALSALVTSLSSLDVSSLASGPVFSQARFSLGFVVLVAMAAFLLGSLLRALVGPTDFVLDMGRDAAAVDSKMLQALHPGQHWRPARRLLEFRLPRLLFGTRVDLMCAAVDQ